MVEMLRGETVLEPAAQVWARERPELGKGHPQAPAQIPGHWVPLVNSQGDATHQSTSWAPMRSWTW